LEQKIISNDSFEAEFEQVDEKEMANYLEENGYDVNAALVASLTEDEIILENDELLIDEEATNNYLNQLKTTTRLN
jgi:hypothetical protein